MQKDKNWNSGNSQGAVDKRSRKKENIKKTRSDGRKRGRFTEFSSK